MVPVHPQIWLPAAIFNFTIFVSPLKLEEEFSGDFVYEFLSISKLLSHLSVHMVNHVVWKPEVHPNIF